MNQSLFIDPLKLWRESFTKLEGAINDMATRRMDTPEFAQALNQFSMASIGMQHVFQKSLDRGFKQLDIPSRKEMASLAAAVQRVEDKLDRLLPPPPAVGAPRPPRTRRPAKA
jgi:hypothetical protein